MLEKALGLDLSNCYRAVLTCEVDEPLSLEIELWANKAVVDGVGKMMDKVVVNITVDDDDDE